VGEEGNRWRTTSEKGKAERNLSGVVCLGFLVWGVGGGWVPVIAKEELSDQKLEEENECRWSIVRKKTSLNRNA